MTGSHPHKLSRRDFARAALGAAALGAVPAQAARRPLEPWAPGFKISLQIPNDFNDDDLTFAKQIGVTHVIAVGGFLRGRKEDRLTFDLAIIHPCDTTPTD